MARASTKAWSALLVCALARVALADDTSVPSLRGDAGVEAPAQSPAQLLAGYLALLESQRLAEEPAESVDELSALLVEAQRASDRGRKDEAMRELLEAVEGPRFVRFASLDPFAAAEGMLASLLLEARALESAERVVDRSLARGAAHPSFGPAYRRAVDIALARGDHAASAERLARRVPAPLPADAASELSYLRALAAYDAGRRDEAKRALLAVSPKSRWHASALYLLGALAAAERDFAEARARFCAVRALSTGETRSHLASARYVATWDQAELGLARIAHEEGRSKEAFDHYFRVPSDSPRLAEALFEAAYASYERGEPDVALDSLAQLEARYPRSPFTAEAGVLHGYLHLSRCDFERAERELTRFEQTFGALLSELDGALASPARTRSLFAEDEREGGFEPALLRGLVTRDPEVDRLRAALHALDAELARGSGTENALRALASRAQGPELPSARPPDDDSDQVRSARLRSQLTELRAGLAGLRRALSKLPEGGDEGRALRQVERDLTARCDRVEARLAALTRAREHSAPPPVGGVLAERLGRDADHVAGVQSRAARVREVLSSALTAAERRALSQLRERLERELRRARLGRIDAVMGKKRKLELEVESLAAGRFPPELPSRRARAPALLRDDEEYWPFEGEAWADERPETTR